MTTLHISTGPGGLMTLSHAALHDAVEAYFYTLSKAQMVARSKSDDVTSDAYFTAMVDALEPLGWNQIRLAPYHHAAGGAPVSPMTAMVDACLQMLSGALPGLPIDVTQVNDSLSAAQAALANPPAEIDRQLTTWWNGTRSGTGRAMSIGPLVEILGVPWVGAAHVSLSLVGDDWRALIRPSSDFSLSAQPMAMSLNWIAYDLIKTGLMSEMHDVVAGHIKEATLDLDQDQLESVS